MLCLLETQDVFITSFVRFVRCEFLKDGSASFHVYWNGNFTGKNRKEKRCVLQLTVSNLDGRNHPILPPYIHPVGPDCSNVPTHTRHRWEQFRRSHPTWDTHIRQSHAPIHLYRRPHPS